MSCWRVINIDTDRMKTRKLNLGCGKDIRPKEDGWINMDLVALPGVDVVWDVKKIPWPFEDNAFDMVYCSHFLEHIPHYIGLAEDGLVAVMKEIYRILKPDGILEIYVPYYLHKNSVKDPTHCRFFDIETFDYFTKGHSLNYYSNLNFSCIAKEFSSFSPRYPHLFRVGKNRLGLFEHAYIRFPFMRPLLLKEPNEIHVTLKKNGEQVKGQEVT